MKKLVKRIVFSVTVLTMLLTQSISFCYAEDSVWKYFDEEIKASSAFVIEPNSNAELYSKNPDVKMAPASLTKIMTALVVFDNVKNLEEKVQFTYNAVTKDIDAKTATIGAQAGDMLTVKDCLYCILLPSANDVAQALAEYVAGNIQDFALLMNAKAKSLGMENTNFVNPTGLEVEGHYSTARDLSLMMSYAVKNTQFLQMSSSFSYTHAPIRRYKKENDSNNTMLNNNSLLIRGSGYFYEGTIAGKTGHTSAAGYCLTSCVRRDGLDLVTTVLGCPKNEDRYNVSRKLYNFYFNNYKSIKLTEEDTRFNTDYNNMDIAGIDLVKPIKITVDSKASLLVPKVVNMKDIESNITFQVTDFNNPYALGTVRYYYDNKIIGEHALIGITEYKENIDISKLNVSSYKNLDEDNTKVSNNEIYINKDAPYYVNADGNVVLSRSLIIIIVIFLILIFVGILVKIISSNMFISVNSSFLHRMTKFMKRFK